MENELHHLGLNVHDDSISIAIAAAGWDGNV
jgi:hypothetical protein